MMNMTTEIPDFGGLHVAAFESRRADEISKLIQKHGGLPHVSPSMREVPLEDERPAVDFAHRLITGGIDVVIFQTGVGFRQLLDIVQRHVDPQRYLNTLADVTTIARGAKSSAAMKAVGLTPTHRAAEPNTWRQTLQVIDSIGSIASQKVAVQEYGQTNPSLIAGLEARGAHVVRVPVYRWELPEDTAPLEANVQALADGQRDVLLFTSAQQLVNVLDIANRLGVTDQVQQRLAETVVASVGPTTSEALRDHQWPVDIEPEHPKMGTLVAAAASRSRDVLARKQRLSVRLSASNLGRPNERAAWFDGPFMRACRREPCDVTPVWLMRQAGRYMQEYREVRAKTTFLELCKNPALCSEVMCTAVDRLGVDAAIIFSDLLPILEPMGLDLEFAQGEGPVIHNPVRGPADVDRVLELESVESLDFVMETVRLTRADLPGHIPLIGFSGAPFTLASYVIEGGSSRNYLHTKTLMYRDPGAWQALMDRFARAITKYLNAQIAAGAQCVQLFDSWVGCLGVADYRQHVQPFVRKIISQLTPGVPVIHFGTGNPALLPLQADCGSSVVGVDWRIGLDDAWNMVGHDVAVQGNLDPCVLLAGREEIRRRVGQVLSQASGRPGHIFNLGHGVLQQTPVENAVAVVEMVHEMSSRP
jgi:uroporphyrinogen decarboxylase